MDRNESISKYVRPDSCGYFWNFVRENELGFGEIDSFLAGIFFSIDSSFVEFHK